MNAATFFERVAELARQGREFAIARLLACEGSVPQDPGAGMIVFPDGTTEFTIGGGPFEASVTRDAVELLRGGTILHKKYDITRRELGMYCSGRAEVLIEGFRKPWKLWIFGGGHVGAALVRLAARVGTFRVTVVDDRAEFASCGRHAEADEVVLTDADWSRGVGDPDSSTFVVILTRCHDVDRRLVARLAPFESAYIGMIGSESKRRALMAELRASGIDSHHLARVETPIGLPIGGKAPEEVALSILARLIQVKNEIETARAVQAAEPGF